MTDYPFFNIDIYDCKVHVIFGDDWKEIAKKIIKERLDQEVDVDNFHALTIHHVGEWKGYHVHDYFMCFRKNCPLNNIYHECMHILMYVIDDFCLGFDISIHEHIAYLGEYIINETMKIYDKMKKDKDNAT